MPSDLSSSSSDHRSPPAPQEFRRYRQFVAGAILLFVSIGSVYLLISVAVTIYRRQNAVPLGSPVGSAPRPGDLESCHDELSDVVESLIKYLENSHRLLGHYDAAEVQRWTEAGSYWRGQWKAAGERCGFGVRRASKRWEELAVIHEEMRETEKRFTREILRFGKELDPRLDRLRDRLERIGSSLRQPPD